MNDYNGFSGAQRLRAQRWLNVMWSRGLLPRPSECCACGQREGILDAHAEDYSEPFAAGKTDAFHLCYRCHMIVHNRRNAPEAWEAYRAAIVAGVRFAPMRSRNWWRFRAQHLIENATAADFSVHAPRPDVLGRLLRHQVGEAANPAEQHEPGLDQLDFRLD
jgi:hypothetical protein